MPNGLVEALRPSSRRPAGRLVPYLLVDRRRLARTRSLAAAARDAGADALELGFPFSDPIADGPTLQEASRRALLHGTRWTDLIVAVRAASRELPCAVMTYANPVFHRGLGTATAALARAGASGLIVPDLSWEESGPWRRAARTSGVALVLMAAPGTPLDRVEQITRQSEGFLYLVSRYGVTGASGVAAPTELEALVARSHRVRPTLPVLVGFGVRSGADGRHVRAIGADGAVVGSAVEEALQRSADAASMRACLGPIAAGLRGS